MKRFLYTLTLFLLLPLVVARLLWRSRRQPDYRRHWRERFGGYPRACSPAQWIWIHAVSVGETRAAEPLVKALRQHYPQHRILLTHMTPTGRATSRHLFAETVEQVYLPYDYPFAVRGFLRFFRPQLGILMETELWPNLIAACAAQRLPLLLVNARLSERSAHRYARFPELMREALRGLAHIAAQGEEDAARLRALGAGQIEVFGNLKFDIEPPPTLLELGRQWRAQIGDRPVFVCASTREGEEVQILASWLAQRRHNHGALLIVVPRHPQRFQEVATLAAKLTLKTLSRSEGLPAADTEVWIGDSMGEMFAYYAVADLAFVGGSLLDFGSQNLIEPCAVGLPVLIGPSTFNFTDAAEDALAVDAARRVATAEELVSNALALLADAAARERMGAAGRRFAAQHQGATQRTLQLIEACLPQASATTDR